MDYSVIGQKIIPLDCGEDTSNPTDSIGGEENNVVRVEESCQFSNEPLNVGEPLSEVSKDGVVFPLVEDVSKNHSFKDSGTDGNKVMAKGLDLNEIPRNKDKGSFGEDICLQTFRFSRKNPYKFDMLSKCDYKNEG